MQRIMDYTLTEDAPLIDGEPLKFGYAHEGDAGIDLVSTEGLYLMYGDVVLVHTGVRVSIPQGCVGFVVPRSGLARDYGITVTNSPGTIDSSYRGELCVIVQHAGKNKPPLDVRVGDRIAQLVVVPFVRCKLNYVDNLDETERGAGGFGSTGR